LRQEISIHFTRFSAFYSPLIATMAGGFLEPQISWKNLAQERR
jgi:hypothetical protein